MTEEERQQVFDALESQAYTGRKSSWGDPSWRATANRREVLNKRKSLLDFLEEIDGDLTVADLREALEEWE